MQDLSYCPLRVDFKTQSGEVKTFKFVEKPLGILFTQHLPIKVGKFRSSQWKRLMLCQLQNMRTALPMLWEMVHHRAARHRRYLTPLRRSPPHTQVSSDNGTSIAAVVIQGRKGSNACINGVYKLTGAVSAGRPIYACQHSALGDNRSRVLLLLFCKHPSPRWVISVSEGVELTKILQDVGSIDSTEFLAFCPDPLFGRWWRVASWFGFETDRKVSVSLRSTNPMPSMESKLQHDFESAAGELFARQLPVFVISLLPDREEAAKDILRSLSASAGHCAGIELLPSIIAAIDTRGIDVLELPDGLLEKLVKTRLGSPPFAWYLACGMSRGALGCALSHAAACRTMLEDPSTPQVALILEDDAVLLPERWAGLADVLTRVEEHHVDLLLLGFSAAASHDLRCHVLNKRILEERPWTLTSRLRISALAISVVCWCQQNNSRRTCACTCQRLITHQSSPMQLVLEEEDKDGEDIAPLAAAAARHSKAFDVLKLIIRVANALVDDSTERLKDAEQQVAELGNADSITDTEFKSVFPKPSKPEPLPTSDITITDASDTPLDAEHESALGYKPGKASGMSRFSTPYDDAEMMQDDSSSGSLLKAPEPKPKASLMPALADHAASSSQPLQHDWSEHSVLVAPGVKFDVVEAGNRDNANGTVLLLGGACETSHTAFRQQIVDLSRHGFHVIAPDLRGYGMSRPPNAPARDMPVGGVYQRDAEDAAAIMAKLDLSEYAILGLSEGANAANHLAATCPGCVTKLLQWGGTAFINNEDVDILSKGELEGIALHNDQRVKMVSDSVLELIQCPTLILHGMQDSHVQAEQASFFASKIKGAAVQVFPTASHFLHLTHPNEFLLVAERFLLAPVGDSPAAWFTGPMPEKKGIQLDKEHIRDDLSHTSPGAASSNSTHPFLATAWRLSKAGEEAKASGMSRLSNPYDDAEMMQDDSSSGSLLKAPEPKPKVQGEQFDDKEDDEDEEEDGEAGHEILAAERMSPAWVANLTSPAPPSTGRSRSGRFSSRWSASELAALMQAVKEVDAIRSKLHDSSNLNDFAEVELRFRHTWPEASMHSTTLRLKYNDLKCQNPRQIQF